MIFLSIFHQLNATVPNLALIANVRLSSFQFAMIRQSLAIS